MLLLQASASSQAPGGDVDRGREIFQANCAMCHGSDATGTMGMHPSLRGAVQRLTLEGVEVAIRNGRATQPPMPAWEGRLTDQQIGDVITYIASLPAGPRNFGPRDGMMNDDGMRDGMMDDGMGGMPTAAVWTGVALAAIAVVVLLALVVPRLLRPAVRRPTPRELLDRRYAAGELSREEYLQRRDDLDA